MPKKREETAPGLRLRHISIQNYKKLDNLEIDLTSPQMKGDLDIRVLGSKNGGGKTSVLECCSLLMLAGATDIEQNRRFRELEPSLNIEDLLVTAGHDKAIIQGTYEKGKEQCEITLNINRNEFEKPTITGKRSIIEHSMKARSELFELSLSSVLAFSGEPLIMPPLLHFNSYRKVQESNPELGMMTEDYPFHRMMRRTGMRSQISTFKLEILRSLMGQASLFEGFDKELSGSILNELNGLIERYCGGRVNNLKALPDNRIDIRIQPINSKKGDSSYSFDGLSSGQKEMIATLFLIWRNSQKSPCIVLIDEPELHLNAEWHSDFVEQLRKLAPNNQYILATHSEEIFRSVDEEQRTLLIPDEEESRS